MSSTLNKAIGTALDAAMTATGGSALQKVASGGGPDLRRYFAETPWQQMEITVYRDKYWSAEGGILRADAYCLVNDYQQALGGTPQSWLKPDYGQPLLHFQLGLSSNAQPFAMELHSLADVTELGERWSRWLQEQALPWLEQLGTAEGVLHRLEGAHAQRACYLAHLGRPQEAAAALQDYLRTLPRNIERPLQQLHSGGLLQESDAALLLRASLQHEDRYREAVEQWLAGR
jgi:hypothetical protein